MMMKDILNGCPGTVTFGPGTQELNIESITSDSRQVSAGAVFFAYKGARFDSHDVAKELYASGSVVCVVAEREIPGVDKLILVENGRKAFAVASRNFFGRPDEEMTVLAVTGTNGKTTSTYLLESILKAAGRHVVRIGTTGATVDGTEYPLNNTTPGAYEFNKLLAEGRVRGCDAAVSEVSSHALEQGRLEGMFFDAAIFTNLTGDHLDYHGDMESYFAAKALLFQDSASKVKVVNIGSEFGKRLAGMVQEGLVTFSSTCEADVYPIEFSFDLNGVRAKVSAFGEVFDVQANLAGQYNLENVLGALAAALALGMDREMVLQGIASLKNVPGRLERYEGNGVTAFVDYAHTDDAMDNALRALRGLAEKRLICVFGAGGDRDRTKRPRMGAVSQKYCDISVVTSDNPRTEDPNRIIADILAGMQQGADVVVEADREKAIAHAVAIAEEGDIIFIGGKGHEDYQTVGTTNYPFDDRLVVKKYLKALV